MESLSVGGLASGLDTNAIIDGLTDLEMVRVRRIESRQKDVEVKLDAFNELQGKIGDFSKKAESLDDIKAFNLFSSQSSDEDRATVSGDENAVPGTFQVEIESLATEWKTTSKAFTSPIAAFGFSGTFEVSKSKDAIENDPSVTSVEIEVDAGDTLKDLVNKINAADGAGVTASIISLGNEDYRLVLSAVDEGTEGFFMKDTGAGNILDSAGLDILNYQQTVYSDFNFRLAAVGAAQTTTQFSELFSGIGSDTAVDAGDEIQISGADANGNAVSGTFTLGAASTLQELLDEVKTVYESQGAAVDVALNSSGEIVITDNSGGVQEMTMTMTFNDVNGSGSDLMLSPAGGTGRVQNVFTNVLSQGKKAFYNVDGLSVASESNEDDKTVTGATFHLHKAKLGELVDLTMERDEDAIKEKVQDFIDSYNAVLKFLEEKSDVNIENEDSTNPNDKQSVRSKGPFASDSAIMRIRGELQRMMTSAISDLSGKSRYTSMASIGITSSSSDGTLSIDDDKFERALKLDFEGVRRLFITSGFSDNPNHQLGIYSKDTKTGVYEIDADNDLMDSDRGTGSSLVAAGRMGDVLTGKEGDSKGLALDAPVGSGSGTFTFVRGIAGQISQYWDQASDKFDGYLTQTRESIERRIESYKERIEETTEKVEAFRARLIRQFAGLEDSMSRLQSQSAAFQSQIGAL
ncbi:flagellar filament capping protein FliD [Fibrobacterota bacterium]